MRKGQDFRTILIYLEVWSKCILPCPFLWTFNIMVYNVHVYTSSTILAFHASWKHRFVDSFFLLQMLLEYLQIISYFFLVLPVLTPIHIRLENGITYGINKHFELFFYNYYFSFVQRIEVCSFLCYPFISSYFIFVLA